MNTIDSQSASPYRVPTSPVNAKLVFIEGRVEEVTLFLSSLSGIHAGPESLDEFLNHTRQFIPVKSKAKDESFLVNRENLQRVEVGLEAPVLFRMEDKMAPCVDLVRFEMANGAMVEGMLQSSGPTEKGRLSDSFNQSQTFIPIQSGEKVSYINKNHVLAVWFS